MELSTMWAANLPEGIHRDGVLLLGDRGGVFFDIWADRLSVATERDGRLVDEVVHVQTADAWLDSWQRQSLAFLESVASRTPPTAAAEHGRDVQTVLDALYRSSESGREVALP
jgi:predicted dehydrogenase